MQSVFSYENYRKLLADYYEARKQENPQFSYQTFSNKAGFPSKGFLYNVIQGRKNLSKTTIFKLCQAMKLNKAESDYFEHLVFFNQAKDFRERDHFFERMTAARASNLEDSKAKKLREDQFEYYSQWYHVVIRSLVDLFPFKDDYRRLAACVRPTITMNQAKKSVALLERLGLIQKQKNDYFKVTSKTVTTGPQVASLAVQRFHLTMMELASKAVKSLPKEKRNVTGLTLGISEKSYPKICDLILACQDQILEVARKDKEADSVHQINFHFFPVSNAGKE